MEDLSRFFTVIGAVFAAARGITDQVKARWPWLGEPRDDPGEEKRRELRVILFNAIISPPSWPAWPPLMSLPSWD